MNLWRKISYWGVSDDMPVYIQKSTVLFNQIIRLFVILFILMAVMTNFVFNVPYVGFLAVIIIPILIFSIFLNHLGKVKYSVLIVSFTLPIIFPLFSAYMKAHGHTDDLILMLVPRLGIILSGLIPVAFLGLYDVKKAGIAILYVGLSFILFDKIHEWFGVHPQNLAYNPDYYPIFSIVSGGAFLVISILILFMQKINTDYEKIITDQRDELSERNAEITQQKEEIEAQRDEIESQRDQISAKNNSITSSIKYAERIQRAILPDENVLQEFFNEHFILFKPRDIVSGDFYWFSRVRPHGKKIEQCVVVAADCTGHGVPGAFMSMLGVSLLNAIIQEKRVTDTAEILNQLREMVKKSLHQTGEIYEAKDGMDLSLCIFDFENLMLHFSGANNPVYIVRNKELTILKPTRNPIGVYRKEKPFESLKYQLQRGDTVYMFSDGYIDQFGGEKGDKFKARRLQEMLLTIQDLPMQNQKKSIETRLSKWMTSRYEQLDDILLLGLKM